LFKERNIEEIWGKYENFLKQFNNENINRMLEDQGQRIITTSMTQRDKEPFCGIGGIVDYSLELARAANKLNKVYEFNISNASIIKCALLSVIGRIGTLDVDRLVNKDSDWHKEKLGQYYEWNEKCPKYRPQDMTLWYIQHYNIPLTWEEWSAIKLVSESNTEITSFYSQDRSNIMLIMQMAHDVVIKIEKDKISGFYVTPF
jgi:hypothetical protein